MQSLFSKSTSRKGSKGTKALIGEPKSITTQHGGSGANVQLGIIIDSKHGLGEFGALKGGHRQIAFAPPPLSPAPSSIEAPGVPAKYTFSPTHIPHRTSSDNSIDSTHYSDTEFGSRPYGYLGGVSSGVVLGLEDVRGVVKDVARELEGRGLATPLLFSNQALELGEGQARGKLLILAYMDMLSSTSSTSKSQSFSNDLQYAKEYELAWFLRWALSRINRKKEGAREIYHGVIEWEVYEEWRGRERAASYPTDAFPYLSALIPSSAYQLLQPLFHLLSRLAAHSHLSGLTPHALSSLFAPLLFNIPVHSPALTSHTAFVRAAAATEHLLLSYIRSTSRSADLGLNDLPLRLKEWVTGYPGMVISINDLVKGLPRKGARVVRCERVTRVVRSYSKDLVATAETWFERDDWGIWERVVLRTKKGQGSRPKYTSGYRRRMVLKETPALPLGIGDSGVMEYGSSELGIKRQERRHSDEEEGRFGSLAGKEWSMFEEGGFGSGAVSGSGLGFGEKLRFDLTETAKLSISERRKTMDWTDFASDSGGFTRTDPALTTTLRFAPPLSASIEQWPKDRVEISKRLQKSQKESVPFHHDTTVKFGEGSGWDGEGDIGDSKGRVYLEEAFVDFWADLAVGGGWVDRSELTFRESNWAIIEYKAKPSLEDTGSREDPRTPSLYFLFEEKVPYDYQYAISNPSEKRAFSLFSRKKKSTTTPSATLPNISSHASAPEGEFDRMLLNRSTTKKVTLNHTKGQEASIWHKQTASPPALGSPSKQGGFIVKSREKVLRPKMVDDKGGRVVDEEKPGFFGRSRGSRDRHGAQAAEMVEFDMQSASRVGSMVQGGGYRDDDKWMDILVANGARRMDRQDATLHPSPPLSQSPERLPPAIYHSPDTSGEVHDDEIQTPRASGFSPQPTSAQVHLGPALPTSPLPPIPLKPKQKSITRKPPPAEDVQYIEGETSRDSWSSTFDRPGLVAPSPRRGRDTLHNIVDSYRDSDISTNTDYDDTGRFSRVTEVETDEMYASDRDRDEGEGEGDEGEMTSPTKSAKGEEVLDSPKPVFDLTPTREPSPGRYRHGEALHFVREEPEVEDRYR